MHNIQDVLFTSPILYLLYL